MDQVESQQSVKRSGGCLLGPISFDCLPNWHNDDHVAAHSAFCRSAESMLKTPYNSPSNLVDQGKLIECARRGMSLNSPSRQQAKRFFEDNFQPHAFGAFEQMDGFVTGYFEPELPAALEQSEEFCVPLYGRPHDLIDIDDQNRPQQLDVSFQYGRRRNGLVEEYFDRGEIQNGALDGQGLELVWLNDKTDAYFVHVQGSARLALTDGTAVRIGFAAKSGHAYTSLGKVLCRQTGIPAEEMTADHLAKWMRTNPGVLNKFMAKNRSYIFFKIIKEGTIAGDGPIGAAQVPLTPGRSLAVDHAFHSYGIPVWVAAAEDLLDEGKEFARLMVAQDTGSVIVGAQRGDVFTGSGSVAGFCAGKIRSPASFALLVPSPRRGSKIPKIR
ncbi:MAG: transglycosylase [Rhizobiaceae bacterium]|nr:transglycosylase [Rhizobiaceae bacterium]